MKRKGFTLIELICVMGILVIIAGISLPIIRPMVIIAKQQEKESIVYLTEDLFCYGKIYSKYNNKALNGIISTKKIVLSDNSGFSRVYELPNGYEFYSSNSNKRFTIKKNGEIDLSTTIDIKSNGKTVGSMSLTGGSESINVKD